jgi:hypothetical protein
MAASNDPELITNRCVCGWEIMGPPDEVVAATIDHGARIHNMVATRAEVLTALGRAPKSDEARRDPA